MSNQETLNESTQSATTGDSDDHANTSPQIVTNEGEDNGIEIVATPVNYVKNENGEKVIGNTNVVNGANGIHDSSNADKYKDQDANPILNKTAELVEHEYMTFVSKFKKAWPHMPSVTIDYRDLELIIPVPINDLSIPTLYKAISNIPRAFYRFLTRTPPPTRAFTALAKSTGRIRAGRMTLILGAPGSGKSLFLKALAGRVSNRLNLKGEVLYNNSTKANLLNQNVYLHKLAAFVNQGDIHLALLTVKETFQFAAANANADVSILNDPEVEKLNERRAELLIQLLGLEECENTIVGNALIRGISGGQKKRVTIGEMMITNARMLILDEISTGLDSAVTFAIVEALQKWTRIMNGTVVTSLLQPTPEVFNLFDDLILLKDGAVVYHGPRDYILDYFDSYGIRPTEDQDAADFLVNFLTQPATIYKKQLRVERKKHAINVQETNGAPEPLLSPKPTQAEHAENMKVPLSATALHDAFKASNTYKSMLADMASVPSLYPDSPKSTASWLESPYAQAQFGLPYVHSLYYHTSQCLARQGTIMSRNKLLIIPRLSIAVFQGFVLGTLFIQLTLDSYNQRLGLIVFSLVFSAFSNLSELPLAAEGKNVVYKQADAGFYPIISYSISVICVHFPLAMTEVFIFSTMVYWISGFVTDAGRYFFFMLIIFCSSLTMSVLYRTVSYITANQFIAQQLDSPITVISLLFGGFLITYNKIPDWLLWVYWISPFSWGLRALAINEYYSSDYDFTVSGERAGQYYMSQFHILDDWAYKWSAIGYYLFAFTLFAFLSYHFLATIRYELTVGTKRTRDEQEEVLLLQLQDIPIMDENGQIIAQAPSNQADVKINLTPYGGETSPAPIGSPAIPQPAAGEVGADAPAGLSLTVPKLFSGAVSRGSSGMKSMRSSLPFEPMNLVFKNIHYEVDVKVGKTMQPRVLLDGINGYVEPGVLTALMGSSGAGKTTLMDLIAGRKNVGRIQGQILLNGYPQNLKTFNRICGYVEQNDLHMPFTTVKEALQFSARLRLPPSVNEEQREVFVNEILELLELKNIENRIIGNEFFPGLAPGQLKLVTIGVELVANPTFLCLDEPTSGLDSRAALNVMRVVRKIASTGRTVLCTIHQPSAEVFFLFDKLLLLRTGGRDVYFGDVGVNGKNLVEFFETAKPEDNPKMPTSTNPASWMLDVIGAAGSASVVNLNKKPVDYANIYKDHVLFKQNMKQLEEYAKPVEGVKPQTFEHVYASSAYIQLEYVLARAFIAYWRNNAFTFTRLILSVILAIIFGLVYLQISADDYSGVQSKLAAIFVTTAFCGSVNSATALPVLVRDRAVFYRELSSYTYTSLIYSLAIFVVELPFILVGSCLFVVIFYFLVGFENDAAAFFQYLLMHYSVSLCFNSVGHLMSAALPNIIAANQLQGLCFFFMFLFGGVFIQPTAIPQGWKWVYYINPLPKGINGIYITQFSDNVIIDDNGSNISALEYVVETFEVGRDAFWKNFGWLMLTLFIMRIIIILSLRFINHSKR